MSSDRHPRPPSGAILRIPLRNWTSDPDPNAPPSAQTLAGTASVASAAGTLSATPIPASAPTSSASSAPTSSASSAPTSSAPRSSADCTAPKAFTAPSAPTSSGASLRRRNPPRAATKDGTKRTSTAPRSSAAPSAPTSSGASLRRRNPPRAATKNATKRTTTVKEARADPLPCSAKSVLPSSTMSRPNNGDLLSGAKIGGKGKSCIGELMHESNDQAKKHPRDRMERDLKSKSVTEQSQSSIAKIAGKGKSCIGELMHESNDQGKKHPRDRMERDLKSKPVVEQSQSSIAKKLQKVIALREKERSRKIERARENFLRIVEEIDTEHTSSLIAVLDEAMSSSDVAVVYHDEMLGHIPPDRSHPEKPERYSCIMQRLRDNNILDRCELFEASPASSEILLDLDVHTPNYLTSVNTLSSMLSEDVGSMAFPDDKDMYVSKGTTRAAFLAAGAAIKACEVVVAGPFMSSFAVVRPPGHHVCKDGPSSGFSFINNVAAAAQHALKKHHLERILILDWDVHHGNGTENIFLEDKRVLFFSIHRYGDGFFPSSGTLKDIGDDPAAGYNINFCCKPGVGDSDYIAVWEDILLPVVNEFNPELVLISCGFDAASGDSGECFVTAEGFAFLLQKLTGHPIVMVLEGGYNLTKNSDSAAACLGVLLGDQIDAVDSSKPPLGSTKKMIQTTRKALMPYWKCFQ